MTEQTAGRSAPPDSVRNKTVETKEGEQRSQKVIMDALKTYLERKEPPTLQYRGLATN